MGYWNISGLLLIVILCVVSAKDEIQYEGLRVDLSALTLNRDILACIAPGLDRTKNHNFKSVSEDGSFFSHLTINKIKVTSLVINENRFDMNRIRYTEPVYELRGLFGCISFHISFEFSMTVLGIPVASGAGSGMVSNVRGSVLVFFNETHPDVQIVHPWDVSNITIPWSLTSPAEWIENLLENKFAPEFIKVVDDSMFDFAHKLLASYERVEDSFEDDIDLVFYNSILAVKPTVDNTYLSIAFNTNVTVNDAFTRNLYRRFTGTVVPQSDFALCFAAQLLPDTLDVLGRGGYHVMHLPPRFWGFDDDSVQTLYPIIPNIANRFPPEAKYEIECTSNSLMSINDLGQRNSTRTILEFQDPLHCNARTTAGKKQLLTINAFVRIQYGLNVSNETFVGYPTKSKLYGFTTLPKLPTSKMQLLQKHVEQFAGMFETGEIVSPGIKVTPTRRSEFKYYGHHIKDEEICMSYAEVRPLAPSKYSFD